MENKEESSELAEGTLERDEINSENDIEVLPEIVSDTKTEKLAELKLTQEDAVQTMSISNTSTKSVVEPPVIVESEETSHLIVESEETSPVVVESGETSHVIVESEETSHVIAESDGGPSKVIVSCTNSNTEESKMGEKLDNSKSTSVPSDLSSPDGESQFSGDHNYELIDNIYYYSDNEKRYMYDSSSSEWKEVDRNAVSDKAGGNEASEFSSEVTTDAEGRQYYYAEGMYLCRDAEENIFFMNENKEWQVWDASQSEKDGPNGTSLPSEDSRWFYYYQGSQRFTRDNFTNKVYKYITETSEWEEHKSKKKKKEVKGDEEEEEFDTSEEGSDEDEVGESHIPPGWMTDPMITHDGRQYIKRDPSDNATYEWEPERRAWFPKVDDEFMANYQLSYGFNPDGTKNLNPVKYDDDDEMDEEREAEEKAKEEEELKKKNAEKRKPGWFDCSDEHNPRVYVSDLPTTMTEEEFIDFMSKCGVLFKDPETQKFKIKMYKDSEGNFKGDALCTYIKIESVELALQILDGARLGSKMVKVERAKFELKGQYDASLKPKKRRKKVLDKIQKNQDKLLAWHPEPMRGQRAKHEVTIIFRNVFDPGEFDELPEKILTHKEGIRLQAETFGETKKIELFDRHIEGVVKVTFIEVECADMCRATLNNRLYLKRKLKVDTWDGKEQFMVEETEEQKDERRKKWEKFLEEGK